MKKKHVLSAILLTLSMAAVTATVCGCSLFSDPADASFPYDAALSSGFTGTEAEYMASQATPSTAERKCYEDAVANGEFSGTYLEFLQQFSASAGNDEKAINEALTSVVCVESSFTGGMSRGSGVIYSLDKEAGTAYIITNYHVVYGKDGLGRYGLANRINVYLYGEYGKHAIAATFYGGAMTYDIAVLKVTDTDLLKDSSASAVKLGDSDSVTVGERVYALGNPNGEGFSVSSGVVSVAFEYVNVARADDRETLSLVEIRTDAAMNHGNSGGGLFNAEGALVGITNARREETTDGTLLYGFGYAIPSNLVCSIVQNVLDNGKALCAQLGITVSVSDSKGVYDEKTSKYFVEEKLTVSGISEASGAGYAEGGLQRGDTLLTATLVRGNTRKTVQLTHLHLFTQLLFEVRSGDTLELTISRKDEIKTTSIPFQKASYFKTIT